MRLLTIGVLAVGVAAAGCNRSATAAATPSPAPKANSNPDASVTAVAWHEVTIPAGTHLAIVLDTSVGSDTSRVEEPVRAHLTQPLTIHGQTVLGEGSRVSGVVTNATRSGKVKGRARLAMRFDTLTPRGDDQRYTIQTVPVGKTAPGTQKKDAVEIGAPAAGGALIGALVGGKKGALIGTAVGGGAGTAVVLSTRGKEVRLSRGAALTLRLSQPVIVRVKS